MGEQEKATEQSKTADWQSGKKDEETEEAGVDKDAWMVTFSDLLQLLITFFVLLISMSSMDDKVIKEMFNVFSGAAGALNLTQSSRTSAVDVVPNFKPDSLSWDELKEVITYDQEIAESRKLLEKEAQTLLITIERSGVEVIKRGEDVALSIPDDAMFDKGSVEIKKSLEPILNRIAGILSISKNNISIEGHTDDIPAKGRIFPSNWEISSARALSVYNYFMSTGLIDTMRMEAKGYSSNKPRVKNISDKYRKYNRRVEIVIKQFEKDSF